MAAEKVGQAQTIASMDRELFRTENQLRTERDNPCNWYINGQDQTFSVIETDSFLMGSPESEDGRSPGESLHRRQVSRRFAMATKKVTRAQ